MSSSAVSSAPQPAHADPAARPATYVEAELRRTQRQLKRADLLAAFALLAAAVAAILLLVVVIDHWLLPLAVWARWLMFLTLLAGVAIYLIRAVLPLLLGRINPVFAARSIEQGAPSLKNSLINFVLFRDDRAGLRSAVYQALESRAAADLARIPPETSVDYSRLIRLGSLLAGILVLAAAYTMLSPKDTFQSLARAAAPWADVPRPTRVRIADVQPGNARVFRGQSLEVTARCYDLRAGEPVRLCWATADGQISGAALEMKSGNSGLVYRSRLGMGDAVEGDAAVSRGNGVDPAGGIQQDLRYWIEAGDARTPDFLVEVDLAPVILVTRVQYAYPAYTRLPAAVIAGEGDLRAVEGTQVTLHAQANLAIAAAAVEFDPDSAPADARAAAGTSLIAAADGIEMQVIGLEASCRFPLALDAARQRPEHESYQLRFLTEAGQRNEQPVLHRIEVLRDLPPEVEVLTPSRDRVEVPEDGLQAIEVRAIDPDFGLRRVRLRGVSGGQTLIDELLLDDSGGYAGQAMGTRQVAPARLGLRAGDELVCWAVAEDNRCGLDELPAPNMAKSREFSIRITAPANRGTPLPEDGSEPTPEPGDASQEPGEPGGKEDPGAGESGEAGQESPAGGGEEGEQGAMSSDDGSPDGAPGSGEDGPSGESAPPQGSPAGGAPQASGSGPEAGGTSSGSGGQNSGGHSSSPGAASAPGSPSESAAGGTSAGEAAGSSPGGAAGGEPAAGEAADGEGGESADAAEPLHDGEAFEKMMEYLQNAEQAGRQESSGSPAGESQSGSPGNPGSAAEPPQAAGSSDARDPRAQQPGGEPAANDRPSGVDSPIANDAAKPSPSPGESPGGRSGSQQSGAGQKTAGSDSAGEAQGENRDRQQRGEGAEESAAASSEPPAPSQSARQSDSRGGQSGDQSGGGKAGAGQGGKLPGNEAAGSNTPADEGGATGQQAGPGEASGQPGAEQAADGRTGRAGEQPGAGSGARGGGESEPQPGAGGQAASADGAQRPGGLTPGAGGDSQGAVRSLGGGQPSPVGQSAEAESGSVPRGEEANLEYARRATDLVLDFLRNRQQTPDERLLEELSWTPQDMQAFLQRWESLRQAARQDPVAAGSWNDALRSLGLRSPRAGVRAVQTDKGSREAASNLGTVGSPPDKYAEQFRAFRKGAARAD